MASAPGDVQAGRIADFLQSQKEAFLADLANKNGKGWQLVMGNEAGDLDTLASSIAFAYLSNALNATRSLPLVLTPKAFMRLRSENELALSKALIPNDVLLHTDDLPLGTKELILAGVRPALVDHNRLLPQFGASPDAYDAVSAIIDHHEDEGYSPSADPRIVKTPVGSCSSLVALNFKEAWTKAISGPAGVQGSPIPPELSTLLLSALLIDTQALKAGGKGTADDIEAAQFLYPLSSLPSTSEADQVAAFTASGGHNDVPPPMLAWADALIKAKFDVSGLNTHDLLLRDYKEYAWHTSSPIFPQVAVGLSTVPVAVADQLAHEPNGWQSFMATGDAYMAEKSLDVLGMLTTYKSAKGKSKRELVLAVRAGGAIPDLPSATHVIDTIAANLSGPEMSDIFDLQDWTSKGRKGELADQAIQSGVLRTDKRVAYVWQQGNAKSTRKQLAPALHSIIGALQ